MNTTILAMLGYITWMLILLVILLSYRTALVMQKHKAPNEFKSDGSDTGGFSQRLVRTLANCTESFAIIVGLMLLAVATSSTSITDPLAFYLLAARFCQSMLHLISISVIAVQLRFTFFVIQLVICGVWIVQLLQKFAA